jgi:uncharacterized protein (DUF924 family)
MGTARAVIDFWFDPRAEKLWFEKDDAFDAEIRERFGDLIADAAAGRLASWETIAAEALALVVALDQFPRNIHRGSHLAFAADPLARAVADRAILRGFDRALPRSRCFFFYLPFEHSEDAADQDRSVALFRTWVESCPPERRAEAEHHFKYILRHQEIVRRFGRFPHRNAALGRPTTAEEADFLKEPHSSF